jgi:hypothetical protein
MNASGEKLGERIGGGRSLDIYFFVCFCGDFLAGGVFLGHFFPDRLVSIETESAVVLLISGFRTN